MANAARDDNHVPVLLGASSVDATPVMAELNPVTGKLLIAITNESVTAVVGTVAARDDNHVVSAYGVSSVDGTTPVPIHATPGGKLLLDFT